MGGGGSGCPGTACSSARAGASPRSPAAAGMSARTLGPCFLPDEVARLAGRVPERRITRAFNAGRSDALLRDGLCQYSDHIRPLSLEPNMYSVLRASNGSGPWTAVGRGHYLACVGSPSPSHAISRGFASEAEGRAYAVGAGLPNALPPDWTA